MKCHEKNSELQRKYNLLPRPVYLRKQSMGTYMYCIKEKIKQNFGKKNLLHEQLKTDVQIYDWFKVSMISKIK